MLNRRRVMSSGVPPSLCQVVGSDYVTWHGSCPRTPCEIMSSRTRKKKRPRAIDTGTLLV